MGLSKLIYFGREKMNYEEYDIDDTGFDEDNFGIADIGKLGEYFDMLYEDAFENKVHGTFMVMQLAKQPENLEALLTNEPLLGALSRLLKEDGKTSLDLMINILYTIEYEERRYEELSKKLLDISVPDEKKKKISLLFQKQEKLQYAEDVNVEMKMTKKNLIPYLIKLLNKENEDLLFLAITFLKKLSIFQENLKEINDPVSTKRLIDLIGHKNEGLANVTLQLLFNLSFDPSIRQSLTDVLPRLVELLKHPTHLQIVLKLLYHISTDEKCKSMFHYTDAIPMIVELVVEYPENHVAKELMALTINLTTNPRNAESFCSSGNGIQRFMDRLIKTHDPLLAKMLRNISDHEKPRQLFRKYMHDLCSMATKTENIDLLVELLGLLGNMNCFKDFSFASLMKQYNMVELIIKNLIPGHNEDDVVLNTIILLGTLVSDEECAMLVAKSPVVRYLCDFFVEKQEDSEILLQTLYSFYKLLCFDVTRQLLLQQKHVIGDMVNLLLDRSEPICRLADLCLDIIAEIDTEWRHILRKIKFEMYNEQWIKGIEEERNLTVSVENGYHSKESQVFREGIHLYDCVQHNPIETDELQTWHVDSD